MTLPQLISFKSSARATSPTETPSWLLLIRHDVRCEDEILRVNVNAKPTKKVRNKLALECLCRGGLAAERLQLESEDFYSATQRLYSQLPIQSLSNSSLKNSIVPVPNLVALSELNDWGFGHLVNKVALREESLGIRDRLDKWSRGGVIGPS